jgi:hypothetical protein
MAADYVSIDTFGWFTSTLVSPDYVSGTYLGYDDIPGDHITKCGINYPNTGYAGGYNNERELFDVVVTEAYNKHGVCMDFYVTTFDASRDKIWGEDHNREFTRRFKVQTFYNLPREERMWTKFGIEGLDNFSLYCSKRHFWEASKYDWAQTNSSAFEPYIPKVGDYLMAGYNQYIYEIVEVKDEIMMNLLSKQHVWEFIVKPFKDEHIATTSATSAAPISAYTNKDSDIFDIADTIDTKSDQGVNYEPGATEDESGDPFGGW